MALFAVNGPAARTDDREDQRAQDEAVMAKYFGVPLPGCVRRKAQDEELDSASLRTPTSVQSYGSGGCFFPPSTSPVKKDSRSCTPTLPGDSPTHTDGSNETECSGERAKLRVSRERNRLHAQRTRIRKRELLERLKEQMDALQDEFELLTHVYDFHATAVCLLSLGMGHDVPCVQQLEQMDVKGTRDCKEDRLMDESDGDDGMHEHEKGCGLGEGDEGCTCLGSVQLNANGRRLHLSTGTCTSAAASTAAASFVPVGSKEERERVRRERNRLHARRARLRKKRVLEKSQQTVYDLQERNGRLRSRLSVLVSSIYGSEVCLDDPDATS
ncbi:unnamed protein product [Hyaloperonospora brassicae]|uniref:BZIP domain-containing protein n=1 Tax=Hyaloperonospora brassicae TaxID=162125 RepID=A0AAV0UDN4_HYABA|nr:unnamed protein product [Hyaloperonospora brassicae]